MKELTEAQKLGIKKADEERTALVKLVIENERLKKLEKEKPKKK